MMADDGTATSTVDPDAAAVSTIEIDVPAADTVPKTTVSPIGIDLPAAAAVDACLQDAGIAVSLGVDAIMRVTLPAGAHISHAQAVATAIKIRTLAGEKRWPLLMDVTGVASVDRETRTVYSASTTISAYALLGATPVDQVLAHFFLGTESPGHPAAFFVSEADAMEWLREQTDAPQ
jgi:hypothetical protein